jgi:dTDP-glucose pyrophosphorylase
MSKNWKESLLQPKATVQDAKRIIDTSSMHIAIVVDEERKLLGIVTQSDYRKGLLRHVNYNGPVTSIMNASPKTALLTDIANKMDEFFIKENLMHLLIVNDEGILVNVEYYDEHLKIDRKENWVVIMAGGLGNRLRPLTEYTPKPLLNMCGKPIIESIIEKFINYGFRKFYLSVNYKADMIEDYFGDGSKLEVQISYMKEVQQMGTAGSLSLLPDIPNKPFITMNADLITDINFQDLINYHLEHKASATMCVKEYDFTVPYGVVKVNDHKIEGLDEKPNQKFFVNAGIYLLGPDILELIPKNVSIDMPDLFKIIIDSNKTTAAFPIHEYWLDIGQMNDYQKANNDHIQNNNRKMIDEDVC